MKRFREFSIALLLLLVAAIGPIALAQPAEMTGLGLSGSAVVRDTLVIESDTMSIVAAFTAGPEWTVQTVGLHPDSLNMIRVYLHPDSVPFRDPIGELVLRIDTASIVVDTAAHPNRIRFRAALAGVLSPYVKSIQAAFGLWSADTAGQTTILSDVHTSYSRVGTIEPLGSSVDGLHARYLRFMDFRTYPPEITSPDSGMVLPRRFKVYYNQPEDAETGSVRLTFTNMDTTLHEAPHVLTLSDTRAGEDKPVSIDGAALFDQEQMDTISGGNSLTDRGDYAIILSYRDINHNLPAADTVLPVHVVLYVPPANLYEPRVGSSDPDSNVQVLFNLPVNADSVWLTFTSVIDSTDSTARNPDSLGSPHVLLLSPTLYGPGLVNFMLDGRNIGTNNPYVIASNRGPEDRLVTGAVYLVTLTYGDTLGNDNVSTSNEGYVWPTDYLTIPGRLLWPPPTTSHLPSIAVSDHVRAEVNVPEPPKRGTVRMTFSATNAALDPGSPHVVYLRIGSPGNHSFELNTLNLPYSELTDSVTGHGTPDQNNRLVDSARYFVRLVYRDSLNNPDAVSPAASITADMHTRPVQILTPASNDTLYPTGLPVTYNQPERAMPGTLRMILTQNGGQSDPGSPHTLYLANDSVLINKTVTLQPANLSASQGVLRVEGGSSLMARSVYQLSILYQDTLGNGDARTDINGLIFPSGTAVLASGRPIGDGRVMPGTLRTLMFRLDLHTVGGFSVLRKLRFSLLGNFTADDIWAPQIQMFASVDTLFSEAEDTLVDHLDNPWGGAEIVFDSLTVPIDESGTSFFVTVFFPETADPGHTMFLYVAGPASIDCGGDPVVAERWPLGSPDTPLGVEVTSFSTAQDTLFGALHVIWTVASETNIAGFSLLRKAENEDSFRVVANWRDHPELVGRGTNPAAMRYDFVDRGLTPGRKYVYRLAWESLSFDHAEYEVEAEGTPRMPPATFILGEAYPNPFNQNVNFSYVVPFTADVEIMIYDVLGRAVRKLVSGHLAPAEYRASWDGRNDGGVALTSGIYWVRLKAGPLYLRARKLVLLK